ncbi:MAG: FtsX-like permease family protein [Blastocatellia bacterium]|nr:FtsX-like permease family protein [Blastocatellia bacterium]
MKFGKLILKNILRNKRRSLLTISSLVVSLFLIITLATILTEFSRGSKEANPSRLVTRHGVSLVFDLPVAYQQRIATVSGVRRVMPFSWFGGIYKEEKNFFANFAVDANQMREIMPELKMPDAQWQQFISDRQGAILGQKLVTLHGFTPGQRITLKSPIYNVDLEFIISGICTGGDEKTMYFHYDYLSESMPEWAKDRVGTYFILANGPADVPRVSQAVDALFINTDAPTKTESEREFALSFQTMMGSVEQFMYGIMGAISFSLLLVMANTMAMSVRERTREVGTLKALGFQRRTIAWLFVGESLLLSLIGGGLGILLATMIFKSVDLSLYIPNFVSFIPATETLTVAFLLALGIGIASVIYSAYRVSGMTIAEALRSTE